MHRHRPFCTACHSGLRPNSLPMIKTYRSRWANVSFGGPGPTPARDAARSKPCSQIHPVHPLQAMTRQSQEAVSGSSRRKPWTSPSSSITSASSDARCRRENRERSRRASQAPRHRCRTSEQIAEHHSGKACRRRCNNVLSPSIQTVTWRRHGHYDLHRRTTSGCALFHRVFFALQFYRPNRSTHSHQGLTR
jgi:hypothetical protein